MRLISIFILVFCYSTVSAQLSTKEQPISFTGEFEGLSNGIDMLPIDRRCMDSLDMKVIEDEDYEDELSGFPPRFGYPHKVDFNTNNSGTWQILSNGDRIWRLTIYCPKAKSINLLYDKYWIPKGGKLFIYTNDKRKSIGAFTCKNNNGDKNNAKGFATGILYSDEITLEYYQPKETKDEAAISISYVIHGYRYIKINKNGFSDSGDCQININSSIGDDWQNEKRAVAMIVVNGNRICTGSLVNTTANDSRPLLLTANHCLQDGNHVQIYDATDPVSSSMPYWSFYWDYELPYYSTNSSTEPPIVSTTGATVVANNEQSDFALLQLIEDPAEEPGLVPYYLGWDCGGTSGFDGACIHHPSGDVKKISTYSSTPNSSFYNSYDNNTNGNHWRVNWEGIGCTEPGSSGSALLNNNHLVIGQLHGGYSSCNNPYGADWYGKISVSWTGNNSTIPQRRLRDWLDPTNSGVTSLYGVYKSSDINIVGSSVVCGTQTYHISYLPYGTSVSWSLTFNSGSSAQLATDTPSTNQCQVTRTASTPFSATLTATITYQGQTIKTLTKALSGNIPIAMSFYTYSTTQGGAGLPHPFGTTNYINVVPNTYYYVTSPSLPGMTLTPSFPSNTPGYTMTRVSETEIEVSLPPSGFMTVAATGSGCDNFSFAFAASSSKSYTLNISGEGDLMQVSLVPNTEVLNARNAGQQVENVNWTLEVYESTKAELTASQKVEGLSCTLDTSRWKPGIYIVRALIGDEALTEKINLK